MLRFPGEGFRTGAFRTAAAFAILLFAAVAAASFLPADPSFSQEASDSASSGGDSSGEDSTSGDDDDNPQEPKEGDTEVWNPVSDRGMVLAISFLLFATIFMGMILYGFRKHIR